jgi:hypothetical protein
MRGKRMTQGMAAGGFDNTCLEPRFLERFLHDRLVEVVPAPFSGLAILSAKRKKLI